MGAGGRDGGMAMSCTGMIMAAISGNHGHTLMIPMADIMAGTTKCYNAAGTAGHPHYITMTAADFTMLRGGGVVTKFSCNGGDHQYVLSCAAGAPAPVAPTCSTTSNEGGTAC
jgi:hypothetical protein